MFITLQLFLPYDILCRIRSKIKKNLSIKYLDTENGMLSFTHDKLAGRIDYSEDDNAIVIEADGWEITSDEFWKIISVYEGFEIEIKIREQ